MTFIKTEFTQLLEVIYPIVSAPMAGAAGFELAGAVSKAGGLGFLGCSTDAEWISSEFQKAKDKAGANKPIGVGFMSWAINPDHPALHAALKLKPEAFWFSFGECKKIVEMVRESCPDSKVFVQIQTVEEALYACNVVGADVIVAQGNEAGGHGLDVNNTTFCLVPEVVDAVGDLVPVLAAGGVSDGRQVAAALMLGASGVVIGTRFCASTESLLTAEAKQRLAETTEGGRTTKRTRAFDRLRNAKWPHQWDARVLKNEVTEHENGIWDLDKLDIDAKRMEYAEAVKCKNLDIMVVYSGTGVGMIKGVWPAARIVENIMREAGDSLRVGAGAIDPAFAKL